MKKLTILLLLLIAGTSAANAQAYVYRFQNPAFGGPNTFNYQWLQSSAQSQDKSKDPNAIDFNSSSFGQSSTNALDDFSRSLSSQLLNRITSQLLSSQFGEQTLKEGTFQFGDLKVNVANGSNGVNIRIVDGKGGETTVTVPYF